MLACDKFIEAEGKGSVVINAKEGCITLKDVLYVPKIAGNFISVARATNNGFTVQFEREFATIKDTKGKRILTAENNLNLYTYIFRHSK